MPRSFTYSAMTLRVKPSGESNREAWFLTAEEGVIHATVFGGPKSRLRAHVAPFHGGTLWIYHDPVRDSRKVSDFDVLSWRPGIRELWERAMTAGAAAETVLSSKGGGGNWEEAVKLAETVLDALDQAKAESCPVIGIYFLWHWAGILGVKPDFLHCSSCNYQVKSGNSLWYSLKEEAFFCEKCLDSVNSTICVGPGAINWLREIDFLPFPELSKASLNPIDRLSLEQVKALSQAILAGALGKRLPTWECI
jgi:DNA repair protein RecO (recombination protein O)